MSALLALPLVRFVTYPLLRKSATATTWSDVGPVQDFASLTAPIAKTITLGGRISFMSFLVSCNELGTGDGARLSKSAHSPRPIACTLIV